MDAKQDHKILIIDDDVDVLHSARMYLKIYFDKVETEQNPTKINQIISTQQFDVVLLDMNFRRGEQDGKEGLYWLERILTISPQTSVILITAYGDIELAVEAMRQGAFNFVLKPWKNNKLLEVIQNAIQAKIAKGKNTTKKPGSKKVTSDEVKIIGNSAAMLEVYTLINKVAATNANVLILGENGTGKDLVAQAIHQQSKRSLMPFVRVDLGGLTPTLFESELFGHVKGAFTDAQQDKIGKVALAQGGTLFLDEIGNLSLAQQAKLLTVLQNKKLSKVGSDHEISVDFRLISATNSPLYEMTEDAQEGNDKFRTDLLYRINTVEITVPPLRDRIEDIPLLTQYFLDIYTIKYNKPALTIHYRALSKLQSYHWPGNVRELQHAVERAIILTTESEIKPEIFTFSTPIQYSESLNEQENLTLDENEKIYIQKVLARNQGNVTKTAKDLGITRTALYRRIDKYNL